MVIRFYLLLVMSKIKVHKIRVGGAFLDPAMPDSWRFLPAIHAFFDHFVEFSGWIWANLAPIYSKRHLQHDNFLSTSIWDIFPLIWESLERSFPPAEAEHR